MALTDPLQWVVIAIVALVFLVWGPKKIPELAKSLGLARREYSSASQEIQKVTNGLQNPGSLLDIFAPVPAVTQPAASTGVTQVEPPTSAPSSTPSETSNDLLAPGASADVSERDPIIETAKKLGISTEGKTSQEISDEIVKRVQNQT